MGRSELDAARATMAIARVDRGHLEPNDEPEGIPGGPYPALKFLAGEYWRARYNLMR